jgi:hypothetical protein
LKRSINTPKDLRYVDWHIFLGLSSDCFFSLRLDFEQLESLLVYLQVTVGTLSKDSPKAQRLMEKDILRSYR